VKPKLDARAALCTGKRKTRWPRLAEARLRKITINDRDSPSISRGRCCA